MDDQPTLTAVKLQRDGDHHWCVVQVWSHGKTYTTTYQDRDEAAHYAYELAQVYDAQLSLPA